MTRNLVVCLDGTGAQPRAKGDSNIIKVFGMLDLTDPSKQVAYYDPGVGTFAAPGAWSPLGRAITRIAGLAFGVGLRQNLGEAYTWLMQEWQPGDRIFLFGFSRGAYTARALSGMLRAIGLLHPGSENLVPYAVAEFARRAGEEHIDWGDIHEFAGVFARKTDGRSTVPVTYLGAFDTVKAAGFLRWDIKWPYTRKLENDLRVRHAVSIDEKRRPFREYLVTPTPASRLEEVWFTGVHTDVGGTFEDDPRLSTVSLKWIVEGAVEEGMIVDPHRYAEVCAVTPANASGLVHTNPWIYKIFVDRQRPIPADAYLHASVRARMEADGGVAPRTAGDTRWADADWTTLRPLPGERASAPAPAAKTPPAGAAAPVPASAPAAPADAVPPTP